MKKFLVGFLLVSSTSAFAAGGSEARTTDMFAPKGGGAEFLVKLTVPTGKVEQSGTSTTFSGMALGLEYAYGFSDMAALYVTQGYSSTEFASSPGTTSKVKGIGDTKVGVKAVVDYGQTFFYYDVGYQLPLLAKAKTDSSGDTTAVNARPELQLQGGVGAAFDLVGLGALLKYDLYQDGDSDVDAAGITITTKNKSGSGMQWKIYAQYQAAFKVGAAYGEMTVDSYDRTTSGVTVSNAKSETKMISVYSIIPVGTTSEVHLEIQKPEVKNSSATYSVYYLSAAYRTTF